MKLTDIIILIAVLLVGCVSTPQDRVFYQAYEAGKSSPAPFFLTIEEAQGYCNKMNKNPENQYQVGIITQ